MPSKAASSKKSPGVVTVMIAALLVVIAVSVAVTILTRKVSGSYNYDGMTVTNNAVRHNTAIGDLRGTRVQLRCPLAAMNPSKPPPANVVAVVNHMSDQLIAIGDDPDHVGYYQDVWLNSHDPDVLNKLYTVLVLEGPSCNN